MKMTLRGADQFYFFLSSDGSMDIHPDNKSSKFKVSLKQEVDFGDEDWEVGLVSINYPYSWTNVGPSAGTVLKYYLDEERGEQQIKFPNWYCRKVEDLIQFIEELFKKNEEGDKEKKSKVWIKLDELQRVKITCGEPQFDIGFSDPLMRILGLSGHPQAQLLTIEAFERRQLHRSVLDSLWRKDIKFDWNSQVCEEIARMTDLKEFGKLMAIYIDFTLLEKFVSEVQNFWDLEGLEIDWSSYLKSAEVQQDPDKTHREKWVRVLHETYLLSVYKQLLDASDQDIYESLPIELGLGWVMYHMKALLGKKKTPSLIRGMLPGNLNPVERMFVYTNIIEPIDFNDETVKLLKLVNTRGKIFTTTQEEFTHPTYFPVQKGKISRIEILITDDRGKPVSFQVGTVILTLHFRKLRRGAVYNV